MILCKLFYDEKLKSIKKRVNFYTDTIAPTLLIYTERVHQSDFLLFSIPVQY